MLRFIPRKYKIPLLRDIYILTHKSAFFNTFYQPFFYIFLPQHFIFKNHHIYQSISYISHLHPVGKNKNNHKHAHIVTAIIVTLFIILTINKIFILSYNFSNNYVWNNIISYTSQKIIRYTLRTNIRKISFLVHTVLKKYHLTPFFKKYYVNQFWKISP